MSDKPKEVREEDMILGMLSGEGDAPEEDFSLQSFTDEERYVEHSLLGTGALKEVYRCYDNKLKRYVALARTREGVDRKFDKTLIYEAWITSALQHPNIIKVYGLGVDERPYFTMDLKENVDLSGYIEGGEDYREALGPFMKVCDAMAYAHSRGIIHLDLKPENIQCGEFSEVLVCDWGIAKRVEDVGEGPLLEHLYEVQGNTIYDEIKGSLGYMAPEQAMPGSVLDQRTDIYALGCILHFILTGKPPFTGDSGDVLKLTREGEVSSIKGAGKKGKVSATLDRIMLKALAKEPADRYQTAQELRVDLQKYLSGHMTSVDRPSVYMRAKSFAKRHKREVAIGSCGLLSLCLIGLVLGWQIQRKADEVEVVKEVNIELSEQSEQIRQMARETRVIFDDQEFWLNNPGGIVERDELTLSEVFEQHQEDLVIKEKLFYLHVVKLDFQSALRYVDERFGSDVQGVVHLVKEMSHFHFSQTDRPERQEFYDLLEKRAEKLNGENGDIMDKVLVAILHYDHKCRYWGPRHNGWVAEVMNQITDKNNSTSAHYHYNRKVLTLTSRGAEQGKVNDTLLIRCLKLLKVKELRLVLDRPFYSSQLAETSFQILDISSCEDFRLNRKLFLNGVTEVRIREGQFTEDELRAFIAPQIPYKIKVNPSR